MRSPFHIFPLGDAAVTIDLGNRIDVLVNRKALAIQHWLIKHPFQGLIDVVVGYSSVSVYYNTITVRKNQTKTGTAYNWVVEQLEQAYAQAEPSATVNNNLIRIPVCYDAPFSPDLASLAQRKRLTPADVVRIHTDTIYNVYMIGFLPGFSYMGQVNKQIAEPRKSNPEPVAAGSVGIAGAQTGIYPLNSPGGWQIIGRTPLKVFEPFAAAPVRLHAGDQVQFYAITLNEYQAIASS